MEKTNNKTPFKDLVNTLKEIKEKPLSDEKINKINSIIENDTSDFEHIEPVKKIARSAQNVESCQ